MLSLKKTQIIMFHPPYFSVQYLSVYANIFFLMFLSSAVCLSHKYSMKMNTVEKHLVFNYEPPDDGMGRAETCCGSMNNFKTGNSL